MDDTFLYFFGLLVVYVSQSYIKISKLKSFVVAFLIFFTFSPFAYAYISITKTDKRTDSIEQSSLNHLVEPITFFVKQIGILIPLLIMFIFLNNKLKIKTNLNDNKLIFLLIINLMPLILVFITSIILGSKIRTMWMTPFYIFLDY